MTLELLFLSSKDDADDGIHVGNIHLSVTVNVGKTHRFGVGDLAQNDSNGGIDIADVHFAIIVHVAANKHGWVTKVNGIVIGIGQWL